MLVDFHMHTAASEDSDAPAVEMCEAAVQRGLAAVAITDHVEMLRYREDGYDMAAAQSWAASGEMAAQFAGRLRVARGVELGQPLYNLAESERLLSEHAYDFVLASQHQLDDGLDFYFYDYTSVDVTATMARYFDAVYQMVQWGKFHSLAHLTYPFRYLPPEKRPADYAAWQPQIDAILRTLAQKGLALEINTSGLRNPALRTTHPDLPIVRRFRELGGEHITVGADAHIPADVGAHIPDALALARAAGFDHYTVYFAGQPEMIPID